MDDEQPTGEDNRPPNAWDRPLPFVSTSAPRLQTIDEDEQGGPPLQPLHLTSPLTVRTTRISPTESNYTSSSDEQVQAPRRILIEGEERPSRRTFIEGEPPSPYDGRQYDHLFLTLTPSEESPPSSEESPPSKEESDHQESIYRDFPFDFF